MKDLAVRLAALDADAGAALRVIAYFDSLVESRAGLQAIVRGAAVLAGCPARLDDGQRRVHVRVGPDGESAPSAGPPAPDWICSEAGTAVLWLERSGTPGPVDAMILERAAGAARAVLDRTRGRAPAADPALVELIIDPTAPADLRVQAVRNLHPAASGLWRAIALPTGPAVIPAGGPLPTAARAGVGPPVEPVDLPTSYAAARVALRFTADGTEEDPGSAVVEYVTLGALALLADLPPTTEVPDLRTLEHASAAAPWVLATLHAYAESPSLRAAAVTLRLHHSTMQDRISQAEHLLGWPIRDPRGRLRLQLALALRRLRRRAGPA